MTDTQLLSEAIDRDDPRTAERLINADPTLLTAPDGDGLSPILRAALHGSRLVVEFLRSRGGSVDAAALLEDGYEYLHDAAEAGDVGLISLLVEIGFDVSAINQQGETPLSRAAEAEHEVEGTGDSRQAVCLLVSLGADPSRALERAVRFHNDSALCLLLDAGVRDDSFLLMAASLGSPGAVKAFIENGAAPNGCDADGRTPLHHCADEGNGWEWYGVEIADLLISGGAQVDAIDNNGGTPLMYCAWHKAESHWASVADDGDYARLADLLISRGASVHRTEACGMTALHIAAMAGGEKTINVLIGAGADIKAKDMDGLTPSLLAEREGNESAFISLAALESRLPMGFFEAVRDGDLNMADDWLTQFPRLAKAVDGVNGTALHMAASGGDLGICRLLLECNADINSRDGNQATPLDLAIAGGYTKLAQSLILWGGHTGI